MTPRGIAIFLFAGVALSPFAVTPRFIDVAKAMGFNASNTYGGQLTKEYIIETTGNGVAIFDYDGDGANDVLITNGTTLDSKGAGGPTPSQLYHNDGHGNFTLVSEQAGFTRVGWAQSVCVGDYDNDGHPDLVITYYGHNILYRNLGNGKFEDATERAGLPVTGTRWGAGCSFVDYDRDGRLDLFISNYVDLDLAKTPKPGEHPDCTWKGLPVMCGPRGLPATSNILYHNDGGGKFTDVSSAAGILTPGKRYGLGTIAADFDNDGWPDIYVACDQTPSLLYHNLGNGKFEERADQAGVAYNFDGKLQAGMGVAVTDYDGNGFLDIVKTNFSGDLPSLYKNEDGKFFSDVALDAGLGRNQLLGWGVVFLDVDEDGWKDIVMANGHVYPEVDRFNLGDRYLQKTLLYRNLGNGRFADITLQAGPAFETARPARGMASGDLDGDGRPEIVIVNMNQTPTVMKNLVPGQNSVAIKLIGTKSNRSAIGARVTISTAGHRQMEEVISGGSFYSQNDLAIYFGLGTHDSIDHMEVRWPSGAKQIWEHVKANQFVTLTEGNSNPVVRPFPRNKRG